LKTQRELNPNKQDDVHPPKLKTLREVGEERDVEVPVPNLETNAEFSDVSSLAKYSTAIVLGHITDEKTSLSEDGNHINTYYTVDVRRVLKDTTSSTFLRPNDQPPLPLTSPLTFVRAGGTVIVNGHRVSAKLKGSEFLKAGKDYVLFMEWSPPFKAYHLMAGSSGAFLVQNDSKIKPLGSEKKLKLQSDGTDLETFISEVLKSE
ncbi:MAG: hypothetical protein ABR577_14260, partial [Pyrinomonadaceae bacterium]